MVGRGTYSFKNSFLLCPTNDNKLLNRFNISTFDRDDLHHNIKREEEKERKREREKDKMKARTQNKEYQIPLRGRMKVLCDGANLLPVRAYCRFGDAST